MPVTAPHPTKEQVAGGALNFVVMGYDSREPSVERSSSLMILHLNAQRDQAYFITFPREMWVSIPGRGNNRINAAYFIGGSPARSVDIGEPDRHTDGPCRTGRCPRLRQAD